MECPKCSTEIGEESHFCSKCGTQVKLAEEAPVSFTKTLQTPSTGVRIGSNFAERYRIVDELGRGGMGIVYKAEDLRLERLVALKFLPPELTQDEAARERFVREARAAAAVTHPNICTIHEIDEFEDQTFIAMEFVEGLSLRQVTKKQAVSVGEALDLAIQIASGLEEAHKKGIIHRDIKSANIMLNKTGQAKIMDFGLAKVSGSALITREGVAMGTVAYMSPEQARGEVVDHRTDVWSLGVVLYEMLSGQLPFWGEKEASILYSIEHREYKAVRVFNPTIPSEFEDIINRCLQKKPQARYTSAEALTADLISYRDSLKAEEAGFFNLKSLLRRLRRPRVAVPMALALIAVFALAAWFFSRQAKVRWAKNVLLPEVGRLIEESRTSDMIPAYNKAVEAERWLKDNPALKNYFDQCSLYISVKTTPSGADIYMKEYSDPEPEWRFVGVSPLKNLRVPFGFLKWKIEKEGFETALAASSTFDFNYDSQKFVPLDLVRRLDPTGSVPNGMVRVSGGNDLEDFFIDRFEVTNRLYQEFMDAGGYRNKDYWYYPFVKDGRTISRDEAMAEFVDRTGRPGPSTWEGGSFSDGEEDYPVSGVSWYEAAAYAAFVGKDLPTLNHWVLATGLAGSSSQVPGFHSVLIPQSKFGGAGPSPVGSHPGISYFGVYDMAGNVREWCWNETDAGRCQRGAAWDEPAYLFTVVLRTSSFDRSDKIGFRCALYPDEAKIPDWARRTLGKAKLPDFRTLPYATDELFESLKERFFYDQADLKGRIEKNDETSQYWDMEKVSFSAAYGNERVGACLFLPKNTSPPYQTVIFFPGSGAWFETSSESIVGSHMFKALLEFVVKNGRAVVYPIYKGLFERGNPDIYLPLHMKFGSYESAEYWNQIMKDFRRTLDYLETRADVDMTKVAIYSYSFGFLVGTILPAVEERLAANIIILSGMVASEREEVNPINYVRRVKIPTLLINGKYDSTFSWEDRGRPLFDLLGTPEDQKHLRICESDHFIEKNIVVEEVLWFLDKYFGPVEYAAQKK